MAARQTMQSRMAFSARSTSSTQCFGESTSALQQCNDKAAIGSSNCENLLTVAKASAESKLEKDLEALHSQCNKINADLLLCQSEEFPTAEEALSCYENEGQKNVSPVSNLSSGARTAKRNRDNTVNTATVESTGCSYDVSTEAEAVSSKIFANLNACLAPGGSWVPVPIPDFGPAPAPTPKPTEKPTEEPVTTVEPEI
ncbi:hypothetical protein ACFFRR_007521 [Megaselia abdita]